MLVSQIEIWAESDRKPSVSQIEIHVNQIEIATVMSWLEKP